MSHFFFSFFLGLKIPVIKWFSILCTRFPQQEEDQLQKCFVLPSTDFCNKRLKIWSSAVAGVTLKERIRGYFWTRYFALLDDSSFVQRTATIFYLHFQRLKCRPVQVSVSRYKIQYLDTRYCILYLYLDTFFGKYLKSICIQILFSESILKVSVSRYFFRKVSLGILYLDTYSVIFFSRASRAIELGDS